MGSGETLRDFLFGPPIRFALCCVFAPTGLLGSGHPPVMSSLIPCGAAAKFLIDCVLSWVSSDFFLLNKCKPVEGVEQGEFQLIKVAMEL